MGRSKGALKKQERAWDPRGGFGAAVLDAIIVLPYPPSPRIMK